MIDRFRVETGARAAFVVAASGVVALVFIALFFTFGQPYGTLNDIALLVMTVALAPVMLAHYELGGFVPLWPARLSLAAGWLAVAGWSVVQAAMILGVIAFDYDHGATGAFAAESLFLVVIGLWIAGASLLAGRWLPGGVRALGVVAGLGTVLIAVGLLLGGVSHPLTYLGGIGYQLILPVWAFLLGRVFLRRVREAAGGAAAAAPGAVAT